MCSLGDGSDLSLKIGQLFSVAFILLNFFSLEYFSILYIVDHYQLGDIDRNLFVLIQTIGTVPSIVSFISLVYRMASVQEYFDRIQKNFDECKYDSIFELRSHLDNCDRFSDETTPSAKIYAQANGLCEKFIKWSITFIGISYMASTLVPIVIGVFFFWIKDGYVETEKLYLPLKMRYVLNLFFHQNVLLVKCRLPRHRTECRSIRPHLEVSLAYS